MNDINNNIYFLKSNNRNIEIKLNQNLELFNIFNNYIDICDKTYIPKNTKISTDQGIINIENIDPNKNTINKKKVISIYKIEKYSLKFIKILKNALANNIPNNDIILSPNHKIIIDGNTIEAKTFLMKHLKNNISLVDFNDVILYNIMIEDFINIRANNLLIQSYIPYDNNFLENINSIKIYEKNKLKELENIKLQKIREENKNKTINKYILWDHWIKYGKNENKKLHLLVNNNNADIYRYKKDNEYLFDEDVHDSLVWLHWIKFGKKEGKIMHSKVNRINADFEKYILDYPFLSKNLNYNHDKIWNNWLKKEKLNGKIMNIKISVKNADFERYKFDYPFLFSNLYKQCEKNKNYTELLKNLNN